MKIFRYGTDFAGWAGETPFFVVINTQDSKESWVVDLDESLWMSERPDLMRAVGEWVLVAKRDVNTMDGVPVVAIRVLDGEQPYYTKRHVGTLSSDSMVVAYGIGKKRVDGHVDRLWILPNGIVCGGDDVDIIATNILKGATAR